MRARGCRRQQYETGSVNWSFCHLLPPSQQLAPAAECGHCFSFASSPQVTLLPFQNSPKASEKFWSCDQCQVSKDTWMQRGKRGATTWAAIVVNARRLKLKRTRVHSLHNWKLQTRFLSLIKNSQWILRRRKTIDSQWMKKQKNWTTCESWEVARLAILHGLSTSKSLVGVKNLDTSKLWWHVISALHFCYFLAVGGDSMKCGGVLINKVVQYQLNLISFNVHQKIPFFLSTS